MAKATGPLLSLEAHGTIKQRITYSQRKGGNVVRLQRKNRYTRSAGQDTQRQKYSDCAVAWNLLSQPEKDSYLPSAKAKKITAFNAFMKVCLVAGPMPPAPGDLLELEDGGLLLLEDGGSIIL